MKRILFLIIFAAFLSGCNKNEGLYQAVLIYQNDQYVLCGNDEENEYSINKRIGIVANKVKPSVVPSSHLWSNYLHKGTELYSSKEDKAVILVKHNGGMEVFKQMNDERK